MQLAPPRPKKMDVETELSNVQRAFSKMNLQHELQHLGNQNSNHDVANWIAKCTNWIVNIDGANRITNFSNWNFKSDFAIWHANCKPCLFKSILQIESLNARNELSNCQIRRNSRSNMHLQRPLQNLRVQFVVMPVACQHKCCKSMCHTLQKQNNNKLVDKHNMENKTGNSQD